MRLNRKTGYALLGIFLAAGSIYGTNCGTTFHARPLSAVERESNAVSFGTANPEVVDPPPADPEPPSVPPAENELAPIAVQQISEEPVAPPQPAGPVENAPPPPPAAPVAPPLPPMPRWKKVTVGSEKTCALTTTGYVYCWGNNHGQYQLGIENTSLNYRTRPTLVDGISQVVDIASDPLSTLSCVIAGQDRSIWCWGSDNSLPMRLAQISNSRDARQVIVSRSTVCGIFDDGGNVFCEGRFSNDIQTRNSLRSGAALFTRARSIATSNNVLCALTSRGVECVGGYIRAGRLGTDVGGASIYGVKNEPTLVGETEFPDGTSVMGFNLGGDGICIQKSDERWFCSGELFTQGTPRTVQLTELPPPALDRTWKQHAFLPTLNHGACRVIGDRHELECTALGDPFLTAGIPATVGGIYTTAVTSTTRFPGLNGIAQLAIGTQHGCAVTQSGNLYCWGTNHSGELGNGLRDRTSAWTRMDQSVIGGSTRFRSVIMARTNAYGCGISTGDGRIACWGYGQSGQLGRTLGQDQTPEQIPQWVPGVTDAQKLVLNSTSACALHGPEGTVSCWGAASSNLVGVQRGNGILAPTVVLSGSATIAGHEDAICSIKAAAGTVECWGIHAAARGFSTSTDDRRAEITSVNFPGAPGRFAKLAPLGERALCAWTEGPTPRAYCWGHAPKWASEVIPNQDGSPPQLTVPRLFSSLDTITEVAASRDDWLCGVHSFGNPFCWVAPDFVSYFGRSVSTFGLSPPDLSQFRTGLTLDDGTGQHTACAINSERQWKCWGDLQVIGGGNAVEGVATELFGASDIAIGFGGLCRIVNGEVTCKGVNIHGQLGFAHAGSWTASPVSVPLDPL